MFCNNCGHRNPEDAKFCSSCGAVLPTSADDTTVTFLPVEGGGETAEEEVGVTLPELGAAVEAGQSFSEVESTKSVSDIYAPLAGTVVDVNTELADAPQRLNEDPYGEGWICVIEPNDAAAYDSLLDADAYRKLISE